MVQVAQVETLVLRVPPEMLEPLATQDQTALVVPVVQQVVRAIQALRVIPAILETMVQVAQVETLVLRVPPETRAVPVIPVAPAVVVLAVLVVPLLTVRAVHQLLA
jgi:hypothetical protein